MPTNAMKSGTNGTVMMTTSALTQSANRMRAPMSSGMVAAVTTAGRAVR